MRVFSEPALERDSEAADLLENLKLSSSPAASTTPSTDSGSHPLASTLTSEDVNLIQGYVETLEQSLSPSPVVDASRPRHHTSTTEKALRELYALSQDATNEDFRVGMVHEVVNLVPVLLRFLRHVQRGSSVESFTLLVLNNISCPPDNKRDIALKHDGARILGRLLCENPSCHLMAIVLVNLTFADAEVRKDMVDEDSNTYLLESLAFCALVASYSREEYDESRSKPATRYGVNDSRTPAELLTVALENDALRRKRSASLLSCSQESSRQVYPDTAHWALCALKNLTRPSMYVNAAHSLIKTGYLPHLMRFVRVERNLEEKSYLNDPRTWHSETSQDAALFVLINLAAVPCARESVCKNDAVEVLSNITKFGVGSEPANVKERAILHFQRFKARMALAFLVGSEGHFGQPKSPVLYNINDDNILEQKDEEKTPLINESDARTLVELLANTLHGRGKDGPGGYSSSTFSLKYVLFALRCLLTSNLNQIEIANSSVAMQINTLLMKVLALHSLCHAYFIDVEAAEHAVFSLYLLSNFGFKVRILSRSPGFDFIILSNLHFSSHLV